MTKLYLKDIFRMVGFLILASIVGITFRSWHFSETNVVVVYIFSVLLTARYTNGYIFGIAASVIATLLFNFLFTEPYFTFSVYNPNYWITFAIMALTSILTSAITSEAKQNAYMAAEAERERYRGNLLRAISHDLRTPLSGIIGTSEIIMSMTDQEDQRYDLANNIHKDAEWLHALVENILNLTRLQDGRLSIKKELEAVEEVVGATLETFEKRAPEYEIDIDIPDSLLLVPMDAHLIGQVIINLLDNAVKHTPKGNEIRLIVKEDLQHKEAVFIVEDTGSGIAPLDLPHIFQMFYTTRTKTSDARRGVGLGLAICETIIIAHGGKIKAQNREDCQGARFIFTLPMA